MFELRYLVIVGYVHYYFVPRSFLSIPELSQKSKLLLASVMRYQACVISPGYLLEGIAVSDETPGNSKPY